MFTTGKRISRCTRKESNKRSLLLDTGKTCRNLNLQEMQMTAGRMGCETNFIEYYLVMYAQHFTLHSTQGLSRHNSDFISSSDIFVLTATIVTAENCHILQCQKQCWHTCASCFCQTEPHDLVSLTKADCLYSELADML